MSRARKAKIYVVPKAKPNQDVIEVLKELLSKAKSGELRSIMAIGTITGGATFGTWSTHEADLYMLLGQASRLQYRVNTLLDADMTVPDEDESS